MEIEKREPCPVSGKQCKFYIYQLDSNGEVAICHCTHKENLDPSEGNCTKGLCPLLPQKAFGVELETDPFDTTIHTMSESQQRIHSETMEELQQEWEDNVLIHKERRMTGRGIRSSQISALVALLVKKGVLE